MYAAHQKAKDLLGWSPKVDLEEGLQMTIEWYRRYLAQFEDSSSPLVQLGL